MWLFEDGGWTLADDPIRWSRTSGDDVRAKRTAKGYRGSGR